MSPFFIAILLYGLCLANAVNFTTVYEWDKFDFVWPSGPESSIGQMKQNFNPLEVEIRFLAVYEGRLFLSLDDTSPGIPATLVWLRKSGSLTASPKLAPFPTWEFHKKDNCNSIQVANGMETDPDGRLWVVDQGNSKCPSKIWIFDLLNNDTTERIHQFPDKVFSHSYSKGWLHDIVLDKTPDDYLAYITDAMSENIVVYSRKTDKSWTVKTPGRKWYSLALSANREARQLYLGRFKSKEMYSVSVSELKKEDGSAAVKLIGEWTGNPYRMLFDSANVLYAASPYKDYLSKSNISEPFREQRLHEVGDLESGRPFTFALDTNGTLWMMERNETEDWTKPKHKLLKAAVGARSYLFGMPTVPVPFADLPLRG